MVSAGVAGVDGWSGGWVAALLRLDDAGQPYGVDWFDVGSAAQVLDLDARLIGIDVPIGLPEEGRRACDLEARARLGAARSSVFFAPPRSVLAYADPARGPDRERYAEANATLAVGQRMSRQLWGIVSRIADMDATLRAAGPLVHERVGEVHPELSFRAAATVSELVITASKKTARGVGERLAVLAVRLPSVDVVGALADAPAKVPVDDALDALAAAWSALRWLHGRAEHVPTGSVSPASADVPRDGTGVPMRMII